MESGVKIISLHEFRVNFTKHLRGNMGKVIYITRFNKLIAEFKVYNDHLKKKAEKKISNNTKSYS